MRQQWIGWSAALAMLCSGMAQAEAHEQTVAEKMRAAQHEVLSPAHRASIERRNQISKKYAASNLHQFQEKDGSITFTNRPDRYRRDPDYTPITIEFEPISVPAKYRVNTHKGNYTSSSLASLIQQYSRKYRLNADLVYAVIKAESNFQPKAVSSAGACGLMQLMPGTAADMGVTDIFDPAQNIAGGTQYLSKMMGLFGNNVRLALAAYNAGPENVKKYNGIPPFKETQNYVRRVLRFQQSYARGGASMKYGDIDHIRTASTRAASVEKYSGKYVVHFSSGLTQPADKVEDRDPFWYIHYGSRTYPVRKALVDRIEDAA